MDDLGQPLPLLMAREIVLWSADRSNVLTASLYSPLIPKKRKETTTKKKTS